ncbi:MAG: hypothetical protein JO023_14980, partial [Chloroflexi bacterium]|nr:hypothetical protein [Chloroflexota bacterium]
MLADALRLVLSALWRALASWSSAARLTSAAFWLEALSAAESLDWRAAWFEHCDESRPPLVPPPPAPPMPAEPPFDIELSVVSHDPANPTV